MCEIKYLGCRTKSITPSILLLIYYCTCFCSFAVYYVVSYIQYTSFKLMCILLCESVFGCVWFTVTNLCDETLWWLSLWSVNTLECSHFWCNKQSAFSFFSFSPDQSCSGFLFSTPMTDVYKRIQNTRMVNVCVFGPSGEFKNIGGMLLDVQLSLCRLWIGMII